MNRSAPVVDAAASLRLRFPGIWREIPLRDDRVAREAVRALVVESLGRADDRARLRAELREQLLAAVAVAREAKADRFVIAIEAIAGLPIPALLGIYSPSIDIAAAASAGAGDVMDVLVDALGAVIDPDDETLPPAAARYATGESEVLVTSRIVEGDSPPPDGTDVPPAPTKDLMIDFWLTVPRQRRAVLLSFSTPAVELREPMYNLFRAIVATATWSEE